MKTIVISGYYGYENIGDEALLASIISALKAELPDAHIIVLSAKPEETGARYGVEAVNRVSLFSVFSALRRADLLISGGGSLLQDVTGPLTIPYYLSIAVMARMLGKPVMFYAQGIGPVNREFGKMLIRLVADRVDMITLRDSASGELLKQIGVHGPPVEITADPVFGMDISGDFDATDILEDTGVTPGSGPAAGIFIREWKGMKGYKKAVAELADNLCRRGWQVVFIPMQYPADLVPAREIAGMMKTRPEFIDKSLTFAQLAGIIKKMDLVIGMRLHALIIATICAVPMVGISYDPKVSDFLEAIGQPAVIGLDTVTAGQLIAEVEKVISNNEGIRGKLLEIRTDLRHKALRNSKIAVELLERKL
ncbi:MAG: polysaccharide pyruvyl transferase CsaB [Firmicutes bacterium HGW-Firmicutes-14]|nr:MAG: polysaccharide pyruvyl transferase CsaB [Firmicutes bacterium HGW-Firmicutes-14]